MPIADLVMPKLGESIMEATILKWHKKVGDKVKQDETVLDIATDKVDSEVPSTSEGIISEILYNVDDVVPIGAVIARINSEVNGSITETPSTSPSDSAASDPVAEIPVEPVAAKKEVSPDAAIPSLVEIADAFHEEAVPYAPTPEKVALPVEQEEKAGTNTNRFYSPLVLNIANSEGIPMGELERIPGTGNEGRVTKKDILQYVVDRKSGKTVARTAEATVSTAKTALPLQLSQAPVAVKRFVPISESGKLADPSEVVLSGETEIIEMDRMRKLIAKHMVNSVRTSPHVTSFAEADVTNMVMWRKKVKTTFENREGTRLTFTPMFIECLVEVMKRFPLINCSLEGDTIVVKKDLNIGMATALPSGNLIVPVIKGAGQLNIVGLSKAVNGLADAARNNKLKPEDTQGGTFTLTNVGTFGSLMGTPIINQPQVAILAVGAIKKRPMVMETEEGDIIAIRHMMYLSLSYDHRIVDGSLGASFLSEVAKAFENWDLDKQWFQYL